MEQEKQLDKIGDMSGEMNPYKELTVNNAEKLEPLMTQMEQWSILSNVLNYMQHDKYPRTYHNLNIKAVNKYSNSLEVRDKRSYGIKLWSHSKNTMRRISGCV